MLTTCSRLEQQRTNAMTVRDEQIKKLEIPIKTPSLRSIFFN